MKLLVFLMAALASLVAVHGAKMIRVAREATRDKSSENTLASLALTAGLGPRVRFRLTNGDVVRSAKGVTRQRLTETYGGLQVVGAAMEAEADLSGRLTGHMYGHVATHLQADIPDPDACQQPINEMLEIAMTAEKRDVNDPSIDQRDGRRLVWVDPDTHEARLAYRVEFFYSNKGVISRPAYYIDACEKTVILHYDLVQNISLGRMPRQEEDDRCDEECDPSAAGVGGNSKTGRIVYNVPGRCLAVQQSGNTCTMRGRYGRVVDNEQSWSRWKQTPISFTCSQGYSDAVNGAFGVAADAMYFGTITGSLYEERYGFRALPYEPRLVVHCGNCYDNAFWDGTDMYFGDGCNTFYPLVSQDVVTHELGHGVTTRNSDLVYSNQPGGINEAFSDISGEVAEVFGRGSNDWRVGYELFQGERSLRYFVRPPDDGRSIMHARNYRSGMDVHYSSGVFNHAFYQLVQVQGMDIYNAYECFVRANQLIWRESTQFDEAACGVMQACYDNGHNHRHVENAFDEVGIDLSSCNFRALSTTVAAGDVREEILVSSARNPILAVENWSGSITIEATAETFGSVKIEVGADPGCEEVFATGSHTLDVNSDLDTVYVKLSLPSDDDVKIVMSVK